MKKRYTALRLISLIYRIIAILLIFVAIGGGILLAFTPTIQIGSIIFEASSEGPSIAAGFGFAISTLIFALGLFGIGELIMLAVSIEENTRLTAAALQRMLKNQ